MLRHMALELPLVFGAGWLLAGVVPAARRATALLAQVDMQGLFGQTLLMLVSACWMVPRALELSLDHPAVAAAKFGSIFLAGAILPGSLARAAVVVQLFYLGNTCWMLAVTGMLYQSEPQRLCNAYLLDDQNQAGLALVIASVVVAILWWRGLLQSKAAPATGGL